MRKLAHAEIVERQVRRAQAKRLPFCAVLDSIRSLHNVGSIFRTADAAGMEKLWLCGATGYPPQGGISKTALGAESHVPWEYRSDIISLLRELKGLGFQVVLLEQIRESIPYDEFVPAAAVCLVIGSEINGIGEQLLALADAAIEIEMSGIKNSLNAAVAFGIAAYQIRSRLLGRDKGVQAL